MDEREILGKNIRRYRLLKGLTQGDLAKKVGLTKDTISKIELGEQKNPGLKYLVLIHRELDISMEELFMADPSTKIIKLVLSDQNVQSLERIFNEIIKRLEKKEE